MKPGLKAISAAFCLASASLVYSAHNPDFHSDGTRQAMRIMDKCRYGGHKQAADQIRRRDCVKVSFF